MFINVRTAEINEDVDKEDEVDEEGEESERGFLCKSRLKSNFKGNCDSFDDSKHHDGNLPDLPPLRILAQDDIGQVPIPL